MLGSNYEQWFGTIEIVLPRSRDSENDFDHFSFPFLEGRISVILALCNYPTKNANFKICFSDIGLKLVLFLVSHFIITNQQLTS